MHPGCFMNSDLIIYNIVDIIKVDKPISVASTDPRTRVFWQRRNLGQQSLSVKMLSFTLNILLGDIQAGVRLFIVHSAIQAIFSFVLDRDNQGPEWSALKRYINGTDAERSDMLKLIPGSSHLHWILRKVVGCAPVIISRKLHTCHSVEMNPTDGGIPFVEVTCDTQRG